eukprot:TRINITY_DN63283_c0_g1_i1.p1 TRINITY_DN63283_c0_g1~~TRINITY_DN63283_c0_g1_i1.p1  ORF type:complete len:245 (+),score=33.20 TRINITY_DN63283_c0_g1_i1:787-1521(+)
MENKMNLQFLCSPNTLPPPVTPRSRLGSRSTSATARSKAPALPFHAPSSLSSRPAKQEQPQPASSRITRNNLVEESPANSRIRVCEKCGVVFSRKVKFLHHLYVEHSIRQHEGRNIIPCSECPSAFLRNTDRSKHVQCVHSRLRPFPCPREECSSSFFFAKDLNKHINTVHLRQKPYRCEQCGRSFGKREHMTSHVKRVHQRLRPFKCEVCNILLASKYNLEGHFNTVSHRTTLQMANSSEKKK